MPEKRLGKVNYLLSVTENTWQKPLFAECFFTPSVFLTTLNNECLRRVTDGKHSEYIFALRCLRDFL
jgi:hypothetical protein